MDRARPRATYADVQALPEGMRGEIIAGELETSPSALPEHGRAQALLGRHIGGPFDDDDDRGGPGGWWIIPEVDVQLSVHDIVRPDLSGWLRERLPSPWGKLPVDIRPDWVCEIISPTSAARDRVAKRELYARAEIPFYWILDPGARVLEALSLSEGRWIELGVFGDRDTSAIPPFDAIELEISRFFSP